VSRVPIPRRTAFGLLCPQTLLSLCLAASFFASSLYSQATAKPSSFDSLAKRADEARDADRLVDAVRLYKKALALQPKWKEGWWSLGMIEYDRNNYAGAARAFRLLLSLAPKDGTARVMLGLCEFELGLDPAALKHIEEGEALGISTDPRLRPVVLYHQGLLQLRAGQFRAAETPLNALCADSIPSDDVLSALGLALFRLRPDSAPPPESAGAQIMRRAGHAACLAAQKKNDDARREYQALASEYPDYPNIHYVFGRFLSDTYEPKLAMAEFQREIEHNPKDVFSRLEIASSEYKIDSAAGLLYAQQAVELNPQLPFARYLLGLLYVDTDNFERAIPELEIAQKAFPKDGRLYLALASAYSRAGRRQDAAKARASFERLSQQANPQAAPTY